MAGIDMEQQTFDEYADEMIKYKMSCRLAHISMLRIIQEIKKNVVWKTLACPFERHLVGSSYEGFPQTACTDIDVMMCKLYPIVLWTSFYQRKGPEFVIAEQDPENPVYLKLKLEDKGCLKKDFRYMIDNDGYLKTSDFIKVNSINDKYSNFDNQEIQGPSMVTMLKSEFIDEKAEMADTVYCLKCQSWPAFTSNFFARKKLNNWPPQKLLDKVKSVDSHVVPVGCPGKETIDNDTQWRLSFSVAERELVTEMYEPYANCMFALKLLKKKYIISSDSDKPTPFCSYFIKTACLWMCETFPHRGYTVMDLIRKVLDWLIDCYQQKHMPHYFISQHNLIGHLSRESCDNVRETLKEVKRDLWTKVLLSIDTEEDNEWHAKFNFFGDTLKITRDNILFKQKVMVQKKNFIEQVNSMRVMNHPQTTEVITNALCDLRSINNNLIHNAHMEKWAGCDLHLYLDTVTSHSQEDILLALRVPEKCILPIIEQVTDLVPKGYGEMFKTRLYRFLGDAYTHLLVPFRNTRFDELLSEYQDRPLHYYRLGAKMVFPDNYSDHGIGGQILVVQYHYLMGNYKELKKMCESILGTVKETKNFNTRIASIDINLKQSLGVNAWATDELLYHLVECTKILHFYMYPVALVQYIKARVLLTEGDTENALHVVMKMKEYLTKTYNPMYQKNIKMFITIIESLVGLITVMRLVVQNGNSLW